jgi:hypothetical protein
MWPHDTQFISSQNPITLWACWMASDVLWRRKLYALICNCASTASHLLRLETSGQVKYIVFIVINVFVVQNTSGITYASPHLRTNKNKNRKGFHCM